MPKLVNEGETETLEAIKARYATLYLGLYEDTTEPAETATLSTLTEQAGGSGYARIALAQADWTITVDIMANLQKTFTAAGADWGNQYGYFIGTTSDNTGKLLTVHHFTNGPFYVADTGSIKITPKIQAS